MQGWSLLSKVAPARESGRVGFFKFGNKDAEGAGIYGSQGRDDFDRDDVEQVKIRPVPTETASGFPFARLSVVLVI